MKWISVKDRLPESEGHYLIAVSHDGNYTVLQCEYTTETFSGSSKLLWINQNFCPDIWNPTHWMPLPKSPKIKDSNEL